MPQISSSNQKRNYTHIMGPVGVVKIEALNRLFAVIFGVGDSCNIVTLFSAIRMFVGLSNVQPIY